MARLARVIAVGIPHHITQRGWGGEFGRAVYCQGKLSETNYGRGHHTKCFAM